METSMSRHNSSRGFTMIEMMAAIVVLTIGLFGMALLMSNMMTGGARSRYMSNAAMLASEELENLQRYSATAPEVAVTSGSTAGSLTADTTASVTSGGSTANVDYFDTVQISATGGAVAETYSTGATYNTIRHSPDGTVTSVSSSTPPATTADTLIYNRRWIIEKDAPVVGVRRVTVLVSLTTPGVTKAVNFQMSTVRP
jgi:prepilin-type N-terminal cleavage/methylation domain-containing protein